MIHTGSLDRFTRNWRRTSASSTIDPLFWIGAFLLGKNNGDGRSVPVLGVSDSDLRFREVPDKGDQPSRMIKVAVGEHDNIQIPRPIPILSALARKNLSSRYRPDLFPAVSKQEREPELSHEIPVGKGIVIDQNSKTEPGGSWRNLFREGDELSLFIGEKVKTMRLYDRVTLLKCQIAIV